MAAEKEYLTYEEAAEYLECKRSTLYSWIVAENIQSHKFRGNKRRFLAIADVKRLKVMRDTPWMAKEQKAVAQHEDIESVA